MHRTVSTSTTALTEVARMLVIFTFPAIPPAPWLHGRSVESRIGSRVRDEEVHYLDADD
jgi:hypothetical protein